jgi:hypothetical protein
MAMNAGRLVHRTYALLEEVEGLVKSGVDLRDSDLSDRKLVASYLGDLRMMLDKLEAGLGLFPRRERR